MGYFHSLLYKLNTGNLFDLKTRVMLGLTNPDTLEEGHLGSQSGASGSWKPDINTQQIRPPTPGIVPATPLGAVRG